MYSSERIKNFMAIIKKDSAARKLRASSLLRHRRHQVCVLERVNEFSDT